MKKDTVYARVAERSMPAHKVGRLWKSQASEIDRWVREAGASVHRPEPGQVTGISDVSEGSLTFVYSPIHRKDVCVTTDPQRASQYALSFTSGCLLTRAALTTAPVYLRERDRDRVRQQSRETPSDCNPESG